MFDLRTRFQLQEECEGGDHFARSGRLSFLSANHAPPVGGDVSVHSSPSTVVA